MTAYTTNQAIEAKRTPDAEWVKGRYVEEQGTLPNHHLVRMPCMELDGSTGLVIVPDDQIRPCQRPCCKEGK